ncbi:hypothetical protein HAX54_019182, partial [Datura stramonium]|nr:hypothetical protein [Datura stramonium]
ASEKENESRKTGMDELENKCERMDELERKYERLAIATFVHPLSHHLQVISRLNY